MEAIKQKESIVLKIDQKLDLLVKKIELLNYINPLNIQSEKERFFKSKFTENPNFVYPKIDFDAFALQRALFKLPIEQIKDTVLHQLYEDIIYDYSGLIECITTIGQEKKFYYNSLRSFGTPTEKDVQNAKFILHFKDEINPVNSLPRYDVKETEKLFRKYSKRYDFDYKITYSDKLSAIAMVLSNDQTLVLNSNHTFSQIDIDILTNHEIGVHMVTTMNSLLNPLKIFSHGFPNNVETQEGLAVFSEYMSNSLTMERLKIIAYRVIAVNSLEKGYDFAQTFKLLNTQYNLDSETAFKITLRVHRGGGFTKDYLYLTGLNKIYKYYQKDNDLAPLLSGKTSLEYLDHINYLYSNDFASKPKYITDSFQKDKNPNKKLDFILKNLV
jgi:uncharacterized protein (TIGR02421 family)